jgi:hypothetical protein
VVLLLLVAAIAAGAYVASTREPVLSPLPAISPEVPEELRGDLERLRDAAEQLGESS